MRSNKNKVYLKNKWHPHMRFCKITSMIILHNFSSSPSSRLRKSCAAFCTAPGVPDVSYSAAANSKDLAGSCDLSCCNRKKEYSRIRVVAGNLLLTTSCIVLKNSTNSKVESLCQSAK